MWMPMKEKAKPPKLDEQKILEGETFCISHPLYRPQKWKGYIFEIKQSNTQN